MRLIELVPAPSTSPLPAIEPDAAPARNTTPTPGGRSHLAAAPPRPQPHLGPELRSARGGHRGSEEGAAALEHATARLTRSITHPVVTDADAAAVLEVLAPLGRGPLLFALTGLEERGLLPRFLEEQAPETRAGFLALLRERRVFVEGAGEAAPSAPLRPPAIPPRLKSVPTHLHTLEALAHGENAQRARAYREARQAYVARYVEMVGKASNRNELELLGPPVHKSRFRSDDVSEHSRTRTRSLNRLIRGATDDDLRDARDAYTSRKLRLAGQRPPLDLQGTFSVSATHRNKQAGLSGTVGRDGVRLQPEVAGAAGPASLKVHFPGDGETPVITGGVRAGVAGASLGSDGTLKLEWHALRVETSPGSGQVGIGVGTPVALTRVLPYEVAAGLSLQLSDPRRAPTIAWGRAPPEAPESLSQGRSWDALTPEQRASLRAEGIRETFWNAVVEASRRAPGDPAGDPAH